MRLKLMRSLFERSAVQVDRAEFLKIDACERPPLSANGVRVLGASRIDLNQMGDARFVDGVILRIGQAAEARGEYRGDGEHAHQTGDDRRNRLEGQCAVTDHDSQCAEKRRDARDGTDCAEMSGRDAQRDQIRRGEQGSAGAEEDVENFKHWRSERLHVLF